MMTYALYHTVLRKILRRAFADLSAGKTENVAKQFRPDATLCFSGNHALGGELHGREDNGAWFARLRRLFPDLSITPLDIVASGGPWATTVATRFRVDAKLPDGTPYRNEGMQYLRLRWASITEDRLYEDTARLCSALETIGQAGNAEALAPPIGS